MLVALHRNPRPSFADFKAQFWAGLNCLGDGAAPAEEIFKALGSRVAEKRDLAFDFESDSLNSLFEEKKKACRELNVQMAEAASDCGLSSDEEARQTQFAPFLSNKLENKDIDLSLRRFKLVNFQHCFSVTDDWSGRVGSRQYRAPEVILSEVTRPVALGREGGCVGAGLHVVRALQGRAMLSDALSPPPFRAD